MVRFPPIANIRGESPLPTHSGHSPQHRNDSNFPLKPAFLVLMAMYHINVRTDSHIASTTDCETQTLDDLRIELARFVGEVLKDHAGQLWVDEEWQVDVTNDEGLILYVIHLSASDTPATKGSVRR